jgi:hypothetical protein
MRRHINWCLVLVLILLLAAPPGVLAARKVFNPLQFTRLGPNNAGTSYWQNPVSLGSGVSGHIEVFVVPLKLPAGAEITGVSYWHSAGSGSGTEVTVQYADDTTPWLGEVSLYRGSSGTVTLPFNPIQVGGFQQPGDKVVRKGRKYMVKIECFPDSFVWEVMVTYKK